MSIPEKLINFLKKHHVFYEVVAHPQRFTSLELAEAEHVSGKEFAKVVMIKAKNENVMTVLPATSTVDFLKLSTVLGTQAVSLEKEADFMSLFPDCELGAMPPFGNLYKVKCFVDKSLKEVGWIHFNAGSHTESIRMLIHDFFRVVKAEVADFK